MSKTKSTLSAEERKQRDERLRVYFNDGKTNEEVAALEGIKVHLAACHRGRLFPKNGFVIVGAGNNGKAKLDDGAYMAFVAENQIAGPENAEIRINGFRRLPERVPFHSSYGSTGALCEAIGDRRAW